MKILAMPFVVLLTIYSFKNIIKTIHNWVWHKKIFTYGTPLVGRIVKKNPYGVIGRSYRRVPVIEFDYKGSTKQIEYWNFVLSQGMKVDDRVFIVYWETYPDRIIVIDKLYWLHYSLLIIMFVIFEFFVIRIIT